MLSKLNNSLRTLNRLAKLLAIVFFLVLSYALLMIAKTPITGYETSIYSATPKIFWIIILFGLFSGLFIVVSNLYQTGKIWIIGLFIIAFCNCLLISLYALRGYVSYLGRGDIAGYIGLAKDISKDGNFGYNFYPMISILISQLSEMTNISVLNISKYLPSVFFTFYFLSNYCWSKSLINDRKFISCSLISSMPIFFAWFSTSIYHESLSLWTLPFFFFLLQRNSDYRFRLFCIIFLIIFPFFHPITSILLLFYLTVLFISEKSNITIKKENISTTLMLLSFVSLIAWFIHQYALLNSIRYVFFQLVNIFKSKPTSFQIIRILNRLGIETAIKSLLLMIFDEIVYYTLSFCVIIMILKKRMIFAELFFKPSICFVTGFLFQSILFFFTKLRTHPDRFINLNSSAMMTPILVGYLLYNFLLNSKKRETLFVLILIFASSVTAISSLYPSPITSHVNSQVTISEVRGMDWLITEKKLELKTADILSPVFRYADLIYGTNFRNGRSDLGGLSNRLAIPDHFGFNEDNILPIDEDRYLVITEFDVRVFTEIWKDIGRFGEEDFIKIDLCTNVDKVYENGEFRSYFVHKDD